jgi:hypothetical protein
MGNRLNLSTRRTRGRGLVLLVALLAVAVGIMLYVRIHESERPPCLSAAAGQHAVQVIYARPAGESPVDPESARIRIRDAVATADDYLAASGPGHRIRWACDEQALSIVEVIVPAIGDDGVMSFAEVVNAVREKGHERHDRLYAIFYPPELGYDEVGEATGPGDASVGPQYAMMAEWSGFWTLHEVGHTLGAVPSKAPHQFARGHCLQLNDVMCRRIEDLDDPLYKEIVEVDCGDAPEWLFDCNHDDYYLHDGDWWDVADSPYLYLAPPEHRPPPVPRDGRAE